MTKQVLITGRERMDFAKRVNDYLASGWKVVPGTLITATSSTNQNFGQQLVARVSENWAVVLEKEEKE